MRGHREIRARLAAHSVALHRRLRSVRSQDGTGEHAAAESAVIRQAYLVSAD